MLYRDDELKELRGYTGKSYVRNGGSEVLVGKDWEQRKKELHGRCKGRCEWLDPETGTRCMSMADDAHHVIKRSQGRDDRLSNLMAVCRDHHNFLDNRKLHWGKRGKQKDDGGEAVEGKADAEVLRVHNGSGT
jgi:hypothetical protein